MNLRHLTDECLLSETKRYVKQERGLLAIVLHHLEEMERRKLYPHYNSLTGYAIGELHYPEDQASRRVAAMHVMREIPEIEAKIEAGHINLTHLGIAKSLFDRKKAKGEALSLPQKRAFLADIAGKSKFETLRAVRRIDGEAARVPDSVRPLGGARNLLTTEITDQVHANIEKLKGLLAHKHPHLTVGELLGLLTDLALELWDPGREPKRKVSEETKAARRRAVRRRDHNACVMCGSTHAVEIDHITPVAMGGEDTLENMRCLCRHCNQRAAVEKFGVDKMAAYFTG